MRVILSIGLVVAVLCLGVAAVEAAPINLKPGPAFFQFNNLEQISASNSIVAPSGASEGNWGVFNVSSIQEGAVATPHEDLSGGPVYFFDDGPSGAFGQGQVSGIFWGITVTSAVLAGSDLTVTATGGFLDLYWEDNGADDITSADMSGTGAPPTIRTADNVAGKFTDGIFLGRLQFSPGIISGDAITTIKGSFDGGTVTGSGKADSFADVMDFNGDGVIDASDGVWAPLLNSDWFFVDNDGDGIKGETGETRDIRFSNFTNGLTSWDGSSSVKGLRSNDPGRANVVPEPATLFLLGSGLFGMGFLKRKSNRS